MTTVIPDTKIGRVIRVGRGWVDVSIGRKIQRVGARPDLLIHAGSYIQILNDQVVAVLPTSDLFASRSTQ